MKVTDDYIVYRKDVDSQSNKSESKHILLSIISFSAFSHDQINDWAYNLCKKDNQKPYKLHTGVFVF